MPISAGPSVTPRPCGVFPAPGDGPQDVPRLPQADRRLLSGRQWFADGKYTVLDPCGFVFYTWGVRRELPMAELKNYSAFKDRMLERPAVRRVIEDEKLKV